METASSHLRNALQTITLVRAEHPEAAADFRLSTGELQGIETRILRALAEIEREDNERAAVGREMADRS